MDYAKKFISGRLLILDTNPSEQTEKRIRNCTVLIVLGLMLLYILPMAVLGEDYLFTVHDGLDSYPGIARILKDNGLYFCMNRDIPFLGGMKGLFLCMTYNLYDFLNCVFGYVPGQILTRMIGIAVGYTSMYGVLNYMFGGCVIQKCLYSLLSIMYAILPCAPNRTIALAFLPLILQLFLVLCRKDTFSGLSFFALFIPIVSNFAGMFVFTVALWCAGTVIAWISKHRLNGSLVFGTIFILAAAIPINFSFLWLALHSAETNRSLIAELYAKSGQAWFPYFKNLLLNGQYHAPGYHGYVLLPLLLFWSVWLFAVGKKLKKEDGTYSLKCVLVIMGWSVWIVSALLMSLQESGVTTGLAVINGFGWGRLIAHTRLFWCVMLGCFTDASFKMIYVKTGKQWQRDVMLGFVLLCAVGAVLKIVFSDTGFPDYVTIYDAYHMKGLIRLAKITVSVLVAGAVFAGLKERIMGAAIGCLVLLQIFYVCIAVNEYNDVGNTMAQYVLRYDGLSMRDFFSEALFDGIKADIGYDGEWVAAYGYHPSVLDYNGFHTLDGYASVHSMEYQLKFREIIAPALDRYEQWREYYDGWGGRMYLYGELPFYPWTDKEAAPSPLYINTDAFQKLGGKYILSRAEISNADELGISFVNDYEREDSFYHIYLYRVKTEGKNTDG